MEATRLEDMKHCEGDVPAAVPQLKDCVHTPCYCEENVWKLCEQVKNKHVAEVKKCFTVFISNKNRQIPIWYQRASQREDRLVIWDYHVVMVYKGEEKSWVYDLDTELPFPCELDRYVTHAIGDDQKLKADFRRLFRVVSGEDYLRVFASDRSHMMKEDGTWLATPPPYPCIHTPECQNNLQDFISMEESRELTAAQLLHTFS